MQQFVVTVTFAGGRTTCDPGSLAVGPGDTVQWICRDGDLALDFGDETPFTSTEVWKAIRGQKTRPAVVKPSLVRGKVFRPAVSINGKLVAESLGDIIVRQP